MAILDWEWGRNSAPREGQKMPWQDLSICMLGNFACFCCRLLTFFKSKFFKNSFKSAIRMSDSLDPDED